MGSVPASIAATVVRFSNVPPRQPRLCPARRARPRWLSCCVYRRGKAEFVQYIARVGGKLVDSEYVAGMEGQRDHRANLVQFDGDCAVIQHAVVRLQLAVVVAAAMYLQIRRTFLSVRHTEAGR